MALLPGWLTVSMLVLGITAAPSWASGESHHLESRPGAVSITLDGDPTDWHDAAGIYLEQSLHSVSISHDRDNLYVMYRFTDRRLARQLLMRGVVLWLNGDGKTKNKGEPYGVRYAGSSQIEEYFDVLDEEAGVRTGAARDRAARVDVFPPGMLAGMPPTPDEVTVIRAGMKKHVPAGAIDMPAAGSAVVDDTFCYELRIPFSDIGGKIATAPAWTKRKIAVGIQPGGLTEAEKEFIQSQMRTARGGTMPGRGGGATAGGSGKPPGGMGGGSMAGMGGSPGGIKGRPGDGPQRLDSETTWLEIVLLPTPFEDPP